MKKKRKEPEKEKSKQSQRKFIVDLLEAIAKIIAAIALLWAAIHQFT